MGNVITIRQADSFDIETMAALEASSQPKPWSVGVFREELEADNRVYLVAESGEIVGFGGVMVVGDEAHLTNLLVAPSERRSGVASRLVEELRAEVVRLGARHLTLEVRTQNEAARSLYAKLGFAPVGIRKNYYGDDDALILWAHDLASTFGGGGEFASGERRGADGNGK